MPNLDEFLKNVKNKGFERTVEERPFYEKPLRNKPERNSRAQKTIEKKEVRSSDVLVSPRQLDEKPTQFASEPTGKIQTNPTIADRLLNSHSAPSLSLSKPDEMLRPAEKESPRHNAYPASEEKLFLRPWQYEMLKFFVQSKFEGDRIRTTYRDLSLRFGRDVSNIRKQLKKFIKANLIEKVTTGWLDENQGSIYKLNIVRINELIVQHELTRVPRQIPFEVPRYEGRSSSNNYFSSTTTMEMPRQLDNGIYSIDLSKLSGVSHEKLKRYIQKYPSLEALQDFVDRVAYAIEAQKGTKNEVRSPGAFLDFCYEHGVDVPSTYRSRRELAEEEALKREQAELESLQKLREERRRVEGEKWKLKFEEWLTMEATKRISEFEQIRKQQFPVNGQYDVPPSVKMTQLKQIQIDVFMLETQAPPNYRDVLLQV